LKLKLIYLFLLIAILGNKAIAQHVYYSANSIGHYESYRKKTIDTNSHSMSSSQFFRTFDFKNDSSNHFSSFTDYDKQRPYLSVDNLHYLSKKKFPFTNKNNNSNSIYKYQSAFYCIKEKDYLLVINPVLNFTAGEEKNQVNKLYQNTRGAEIWGNIGGHKKGIGFYSLFTENQTMLPSYYRFFHDSLNHVPNELFFKKFKKAGAVDFFQARAYFTFNAINNYIKFQFGHDKHKIGNGYRSLILNDFAPQYLFFKINTDIKRFHYQNLFTQFNDNGLILGNTLFGKKYGAFHRLSFDVRKNLSIGLNEMVIFDRIDSTQKNQFDLNYLNPVIFYRAVESNLGSRDNSLMALDFEWNIKHQYVIYGQFLLDEFNLKFIKEEPNWWANKYGYQIGARSFNLLNIKNLDLLIEYNRMRPYTYSHYRTTQSYSHFNQALAHPLGANFSEIILEARYQFKNKWNVQATFINAITGKDSFLTGRNYGGNILRDYRDRATEFDSKMFMGKKTNLKIIELNVSYMLKHNVFIDGRINYRQINQTHQLFYTLGIRINNCLRPFNY